MTGLAGDSHLNAFDAHQRKHRLRTISSSLTSGPEAAMFAPL